MKKTSPPLSKTFVRAALAGVFGCLSPALVSHAQAQAAYVFTKIVDGNDPIPNGQGVLFAPTLQPSLDLDGKVAFRNGGSLNPDSIWAATAGTTPIKLIDLNTAVPGGTGKFSALLNTYSNPGNPQIRNGSIVFGGQDSSTAGGFHAGLYAAPASGAGPVTRVVDYKSSVPGGTGAFNSGLGNFSLDNGRVEFSGSGPGNGGIFAANLNGSSLVAVADGLHPASSGTAFNVVNFALPSLSGGTAAFYGTTVFDPSNGFNALYTAPASGGFAYNQFATSNTPLPGDPNGSFHTRFNAPHLDGNSVAFVADDSFSSPNYFGLFTTTNAGGALKKIVSSTGAAPAGLLNLNGGIGDLSLQGGQVIFIASDNADHIGLYSGNVSTGAVSKIFVTGDLGPFADTDALVGGVTGNTLSISSTSLKYGQFVLRLGNGIYLGTPVAQSADLQTTATAAPTSPAIGGNVTYTLKVTNAGPATATNVSGSFRLPPGLTFISSTLGSYSSTARTVNFTLGNRASAAVSTFQVTARVDASGDLTASLDAFSVTPDPLRNNNYAPVTVPAPAPLAVSSYVFKKIVDGNLSVPGQTAVKFAIPGGNDPLAALDGNKVIFISIDAGQPVIWSTDTDASGYFTKLADTNTTEPGTTEKFGYFKNLRLRNDLAVFFGYGVNSDHDGFYSIPAGGGTVKVIADQNTVRLDGSGLKFSYQDFNQGTTGYLGDGQMTFAAASGVYAYPAAGGAGRTAIYPGTSIPVRDRSVVFFGATAISGNFMTFEGSGGTSALNGLYLDSRRFVTLVDNNTPSPSTPGQKFVVGNGNSFSNTQVEGNTVVFAAYSGTNASVRGLYSIQRTGGAAVKLVDTNTTVPGKTTKFASFSASGSPEIICLNAGEVSFIGTDTAGVSGLYSVPATGGTIKKIIAIGDMLDANLKLAGNPGFYQTPIQPNSLGQHRLVFRADFTDINTNAGGTGLFIATPATLAKPGFFHNQVAVGNGVNYLQFPNGTPFGYYSYLTDPNYIYHFDLGYEYIFDANDAMGGVYFYDFASGDFFYTSPQYPFPYLYDFTLNTVLYYYPDTTNPGHYTTNPRYFYNFATGQIITR